MEKCNNLLCVKHMPIVHNPGCSTSGTNKCQDVLHNKMCHTKDDLELLVKCFDNYITE